MVREALAIVLTETAAILRGHLSWAFADLATQLHVDHVPSA
jgi:hypothetical protein